MYLRDVLAPYFNEIYLMPDSPVLIDVTSVLKKHLEAPRRYQTVFIGSEKAIHL